MQFRMRYCALFLTMILTIALCFAADFKNNLMAISFEPGASGTVNMILQTKVPYNGNVTPIRQGSDTYILMLPEVNNSASNPDISNTPEISNVNIRTMPYSSSGNGYTKIVIKTMSQVNLAGHNKVYSISSQKKSDDIENEEDSSSKEITRTRTRSNYSNSRYSDNPNRNTNRKYQQRRNNSYAEKRQNKVEQPSSLSTNTVEEESYTNLNPSAEETTPESETTSVNNTNENDFGEILLIIFGVILIVACSIYFYVRVKNKLTEIAGERLDIEVDEKPEQKKEEKSITKIKNTINAIDKKYSSPYKMPQVSEYNEFIKPSASTKIEKSTDDLNIVDLDALFKKQQKLSGSNNENDALEDFLSGFSFNETKESQEHQEEENEFDEEAFNQIIQDNDLKFSKSDIECVEKIVNSEISEDTMQNIEKYAVSDPIKKTKKQLLEEFITTYSISQNIIFKQDDIDVLYKLMNVEIDKDFVTDLRTNHSRTIDMEQELLDSYNTQEYKKPSEIVTLKVSDLLPNLSEVLANPDKYADKRVERAVADENEMLKNIENVTFKPFDDGTRTFEILNTTEDLENLTQDFVVEIRSTKPAEKKQSEPKPTIASQPVRKGQTTQTPKPEPQINRQSVKRITPNPVKAPEPAKPAVPQSKPAQQSEDNNIKCILDGKSYSVLSSVNLIDNIGCHLAKNNDGYIVLAYVGDRLSPLRQFDNIKSENISARLSEKLASGALRYIVRLGATKFIVEVKDGCVNYVMDL